MLRQVSLILNMRYSWKQFFFIFLIIGLASIVAIMIFHSKEITPKKGIYFWESGRSSLSTSEFNFIEEEKIERVYVKFFEIENESGTNTLPISKTLLNLKQRNLKGVEIIPTVYIKNEVFKNISETEIEELADNVHYLIIKKFSDQFSSDVSKLKEIQMDCDWTISTQKNYFLFLKQLKQKGNFTLSATLRLYPYKFPNKMGVLPVDRAMLICYNLISPLEAGSRNSILDLVELEKYLVGAKEYPIPLDVALPIYSAALIVQNNHFIGIHYLQNEALKKELICEKEPWYFSKKDTVLNHLYLRKGDKVKLETISTERIELALKIIRKNVIFSKGATLALFHLQENQIKQFTHAEISSFYNSLSSH